MFYLYKNEDYLITPLDSTAVDVSDYTNVIIVDDYIFIPTSSSPYLRVYSIISGSCQAVSLSNANALADYSFELNSFDATITKDGDVRIVGIRPSTGYGICYCGSFNGLTNIAIESLVQTSKSNMMKAVCLYKNNFCDSIPYFLTTAANGVNGFIFLESVDESGNLVYEGNTHALSYDLLVSSTSVGAFNRVIYSVKAASGGASLLNTYFFPEQRRYNIPNDGETDIWVSPDFNYCIKKYSSTSYKIFNLVGYSTPVEFDDSSVFDNLNQATFVDFVFLKDSLIILTNDVITSIIIINLNLTNAVIEGLSDDLSSAVSVTTKRYHILGSETSENVEAKLTLKISGFGE